MDLEYSNIKNIILKLENKIKKSKIYEFKILKRSFYKKRKLIFKTFNDWELVKLARHPLRPNFLDYKNNIFKDFEELHGDRCFGNDKAIIGGIAKIDNIPVLLIGNQKGRSIKEKKIHNYGMANPEGYRKAFRLFNLAEKFNLPIIIFIDTPGAYPGIEAEERNQSEAIAKNLSMMSKLKTIIIGIIIGEGCSGGALGIGICDKMLILEHSYFSVITPEGCSIILNEKNKNIDKITNNMNIVANKIINMNIIDEIIIEESGGAQRNINKTSTVIKSYILKNLNILLKLSTKKLLILRSDKLINLGFNVI